MQKLFKYLISCFLSIHTDAVYKTNEALTVLFIALACIFGVFATIGIVGHIVVLSIDAHKERKNGASSQSEKNSKQ